MLSYIISLHITLYYALQISRSQSEDMKTRNLDKPNSLTENSETSTSQINYGVLEISISQYTYRDVKFSIHQTGDLELKISKYKIADQFNIQN